MGVLVYTYLPLQGHITLVATPQKSTIINHHNKLCRIQYSCQHFSANDCLWLLGAPCLLSLSDICRGTKLLTSVTVCHGTSVFTFYVKVKLLSYTKHWWPESRLRCTAFFECTVMLPARQLDRPTRRFSKRRGQEYNDGGVFLRQLFRSLNWTKFLITCI